MKNTPTIAFSVRADERTRHEPEELTEHAESRSEAIHAAYRRTWQERIRVEAPDLANDPEDLAEMRAIREEADELRAW